MLKNFCRALMLVGLVCASPAFADDPAPIIKNEQNAAESERVLKLIEEAKKEGSFHWAGVFIEPEEARKIQDEFKLYYGLPDLKMEYSFVGSGPLATQVEQQIKANKTNFDIVWASAWSWFKDLHRRGEILQYHSPYYDQYTLSKKAGLSLDGYWASDARTYQPMYNVKVLEQKGIRNFEPKSWNDFLDPRFEGMVSLGDVNQSFSFAEMAESIRRTNGDEFFYKLGKIVKPVYFAKTAEGRSWVGSGEFPITLMGHGKNASILRNQKIDVKLVFPSEGVLLMPDTPVILKKAPHPNASRLFMDFVRSAHGVETIKNSGAELFFGRPGVKTSNPELFPTWEDVKAISMDWDTSTPDSIKKIRDLLKKAGIGKAG